MMKSITVVNHVRLSLLGALDGLIFGVAVEVLRRIYTPIFIEYYLTRELEESESKVIPSITGWMGGYLEIPLLCLVVFAVITPPVFIYLRRYFQSPPVLWQLSGMIAATVTVLLHNLLNPFGHHTWLLPLGWRWLFCITLIASINLIYGLSLDGWKKSHSSKVYR